MWLQTCFDALDGLGQDEGLTLEYEGQQWRVDRFIEELRTRKESAGFFGLTLDGLLGRTVMPPRDKEILTDMVMDRLSLPSSRVALAKLL